MNYDPRYPSIHHLKIRARRRMPKFAFDYADGAIDGEHGKARNRAAWHSVVLTPRYLRDVSATDLTAEMFGHRYALPVGVAPIGLGNMLWAGAEMTLARAAQRANIPYILSTFSTTTLEEIARAAPDVCWFQLYVPQEVQVMDDLLARAWNAGVRVLVVTVDIPVGAKRNRELINGLQLPFKVNARLIAQCLARPAWTVGTVMAALRGGLPNFANVTRYQAAGRPADGLAKFITAFNMHGVTRDRLAMIREKWRGAVVIKGVQHPDDMRAAVALGMDGIVVSNHGGRQLDAAPATADTLRVVPPEVADALTVIADSGIRTGTDVVRAAALGADFTLAGRAFFWGVGALGSRGGEQVIGIFADEIGRTLKQIGCGEVGDAHRHL